MPPLEAFFSHPNRILSSLKTLFTGQVPCDWVSFPFERKKSDVLYVALCFSWMLSSDSALEHFKSAALFSSSSNWRAALRKIDYSLSLFVFNTSSMLTDVSDLIDGGRFWPPTSVSSILWKITRFSLFWSSGVTVAVVAITPRRASSMSETSTQHSWLLSRLFTLQL